MLQAVSKDGALMTPALFSNSRIASMRGQAFYCPACKEKVLLRAGEFVTPHFAHFKNATCLQGKGESHYHRIGKLQLYDWLHQQYPYITLEHHLPEINQWPDIFLHHPQKQIALEFQCAKINPKEILQRNEGYGKLNIQPIWILGAKRFKRISKNKMIIDTFTFQFLQQYTPSLPVQLLYYCPETFTFLLVSDIYIVNRQQAIACFSFYKAKSITFPHLFRPKYLSKKQLYKSWYAEKSAFRLNHKKIYGKEKDFRNWLYQHQLHIENLPGIVHLPNPAQYKMNSPLWHWQSRFVIGFLDRLTIGASFDMQDVQAFLAPYYRTVFYTQSKKHTINPGQSYIDQLKTLGVIEINPSGRIIKRREIYFYRHLEEAMRGDRAVLKRLMEKDN